MAEKNNDGDAVAIIGAGVIGCAMAWALARSDRRVLVLDRADAATAGAWFGNAVISPPSRSSPCLSCVCWRSGASCFLGGPLDIPARRLAVLAPWLLRFAIAWFHQREHARHLGPLVRYATRALASQLEQVGRGPRSARRNGHYAIWLGPRAERRAAAARMIADGLQVGTREVPSDLLRLELPRSGRRVRCRHLFP